MKVFTNFITAINDTRAIHYACNRCNCDYLADHYYQTCLHDFWNHCD